MRVVIAAFCLFVAVNAYDAVVFSENNDISSSNIEELLSSASSSNPLVFIINPDFTLGQFSVKVNAYSSEPTTDYLAKTVKSSKYHATQYFSNQVSVENSKVLTAASQYESGASVYIIAGEEWTSAQELASQLLPKIEGAVGVLTSSDAISHDKNRVKRVATPEMEDDAATGQTGSTGSADVDLNQPLPLILPPYNVSAYPSVKPSSAHSCLLYLEGLSVVVEQKVDKTHLYAAALVKDSDANWGYADGDVSCQNGTIGEFLFRVRLSTNNVISGKTETTEKFSIKQGQIIDVTFNFTGDDFGYWKLTGATLNQISIDGKDNFKSASVNGESVGELATQYSGLDSVAGWSVSCTQTQSVFFKSTDDDVRIGISLYNTQVQTFTLLNKWEEQARFTLQSEDCTGTFSPGSWMGIVSVLVLIGGLLFGYIMLQSVQSQDRYDDPKQKQIVINVRE